MNRRSIQALGAATFVLVLASSAVALGAGTKVTVSIEGRTRALLAPTVVQTHAGFITKGGAPAGACPATNAAGALDVATHHRWNAKFYASYADDLVESVLGDTETGKAYYWGVWLDNRYASAGICELKLHAGDRLLFAVDSASHHEHPIAVTGPRSAKTGGSFTVKVVWHSDAGVPKPLAHARVHGSGVSATTNSHGTAMIVAPHAGTLVLQADRSGYIRATPVRVRVTG